MVYEVKGGLYLYQDRVQGVLGSQGRSRKLKYVKLNELDDRKGK